MLLAALLAFLPTLNAQSDKFGLPAEALTKVGLPACGASHHELAVRSAFTLCFDSSRRVPLWTAYQLAGLPTPAAPRPNHFRHDYKLSSPSAYEADYRSSGWVRGHLVPAVDMAFSDESIRDSFLLSNAVPQDSRMNNSTWRAVENAIRRLAAESSVIIFTGVLFDCQSEPIGPHHVGVPCSLYKAVLVEHNGQKAMYAVIVPNDASATGLLSRYAVSIDELQRRTGLNFFSQLEESEQQRLEADPQPLPTR